MNMNMNIIGIYIIYNSFVFKSKGLFLLFFKFIPKVASNQHLENPINPNTLAIKNTKSVNVDVNSKRPQNI